jgi:GH15 family glucan-1,4-alpha-glucosidase
MGMPGNPANENKKVADAMEPYLAIEKHALISDRRTAAMVGANGCIDWWCLPDFDGEAVFGALLDQGRGGFWRAGFAQPILGEQEYIDDSTTVKTRWNRGYAELELVDALLWPERANNDPYGSRRVLLRRLQCLKGEALCTVELSPRKMFGESYPLRGRTGSPPEHQDWLGLWISDPVLEESVQNNGRATFELDEGQCIWMVLGYRELAEGWSEEYAEKALNETIAAWSVWSAKHPYFGPRKKPVLRSVTTIRALSYAPNGSQVAAPTCSLPEKIGGGRNYDYRYAWIRDSSLALAILSVFGDLKASEQYMDWLAQLKSSNEMPLQVIYRINGECDIPQKELSGVEGYCGSQPVRQGNNAAQQFQLDSMGYFADCAHIYLQQGGKWKPEYWELIKRIADFTVENWMRKDNGIWELSEQRHYVSSKVMSWVILDRACRIMELLGTGENVDKWQAVMHQIRDEVMEKGWSESLHAFRQHYDSDDLDASVLLMATMGFMPADHPRMLSTVKAIRQHLEKDRLIWRFHPRSMGQPDMPLDGMEAAFLPCTFWLASTLARQGQRDEAEAILDRVENAFGQLGIYPEEADPGSNAALGNMPMIFSHAEYLKAVMDCAKGGPLTAVEMMAGKAARRVVRTFGAA